MLLAVGSHFEPPVVLPGTGYDGVVQVEGYGPGSGVLLSDGRHVLTAAHVFDPGHTGRVATRTYWVTMEWAQDAVGDPPSYFFDETAVTLHPDWVASVGSAGEPGNDLAIIELMTRDGRDLIAHGGRLSGFDIYRGSDEVGQPFDLMGYGMWGSDGNVGPGTDAAHTYGTKRSGDNRFDATGTRMRNSVASIHVRAGGGSFHLTFQGERTGDIPYNASTQQVAASLNGLSTIRAGGGYVNVSGNTGDWYIEFAGGWAGRQVPLFTYGKDSLAGSISVSGEFNGGNNWGGDKDLIADFDDGTIAHDALGQVFGLRDLGLGSNTEALTAAGDSGGPAFIGDRIAGISAGLVGNWSTAVNYNPTNPPSWQQVVFGSVGTWTRVSRYQGWIDSQMDDGNLDLMLDMRDQPWGGDGIADDIRLRVASGDLQMVVNGNVVYQDASNHIRSLEIDGTWDGETLTIEPSAVLVLGFPITWNGTTWNGDGGHDRLVIDDSADSAPSAVTVGASTVGAGATDTLFPSGGSVNLQGMSEVEVRLGPGGGAVDASAATLPVIATTSAGGGVLIPGQTRLQFHGGAGADTIRISDSGAMLDLGSFSGGRVAGLEYVDITGSGPNRLTINVADVLSTSAPSNRLVVHANADDQVNLLPGCTLAGVQTVDGQTYAAYTQSSATVLVSTAAIIRVDSILAADDLYTVSEDQTRAADAMAGVLANDSTAVGNALAAKLVQEPAFAASFALHADGSFTYTPTAHFTGADSFTYVASYGGFDSNVATVTLTIAPINDPPVAVNDGYTVASGGTLQTIPSWYVADAADVPKSIANGCTAVSGMMIRGLVGVLTDVDVTLNINGTYDLDIVLVSPDGTRVKLIESIGLEGADLVDTTLTDQALLSIKGATGSRTGRFRPVGRLADLNGESGNGLWQLHVLDHETGHTGTLAGWKLTWTTTGGETGGDFNGVLGNDSDVDSDNRTAQLVTPPVHASSFTLNADGSFTYVHDGHSSLPDSFTYRASDGQGQSNLATVKISLPPFGLVGTPIRVTSTPIYGGVGNDQTLGLAMDAAGDFVVTYRNPDNASCEQKGDNWVCNFTPVPYGQRFNSEGDPVGNRFRLGTAQTVGDEPVVAMAPDGRFVAVWEKGDVYAQPYTSAGLAVGSPVKVNTPALSYGPAPAVAMDANGNFVVVWRSWQSGQDPEVRARRYNAAGSPLGSEWVVSAVGSHVQDTPAVAVSQNGDFVIAWEISVALPNNDWQTDVYARRYNAAGVAQGGAFRVNSVTEDYQSRPALAMDGKGDFVVVFDSWVMGDNSRSGLFGRWYNSSGVAQGASEFRISPNSGERNVAMTADGDFVVVWTSGYGGAAVISARAYAAPLVGREPLPKGDAFRVNPSFADGRHEYPRVAADSHGNFVVVWYRRLAGEHGDSDVFAQRCGYTGAGTQPPQAFGDAYSTNEGIPLTADADHGVIANDRHPDNERFYNQSFEDGGSNSWVVASPTSGLQYAINDSEALHGFYDLDFYSGSSATLQPGDYISASQDVDLTAVTSLLFDVSLAPSGYGAPLHAEARILVDGTVRWTREIAGEWQDVSVDLTPLGLTGTHTVTAQLYVTSPGAVGHLRFDDFRTRGYPLPNSLTSVLLTPPAHAAAFALLPDGSFSYTPEPLYYGTDTFTYRISDGALESSPATATLTVNHVNHPPLAAGDTFVVRRGQVLRAGPQARIVEATDVPKEIAPWESVSSSVTVSGVPTPITDLELALSIYYDDYYDISAELGSPSGTWVELFTEEGAAWDLSDFKGEDPNGTWTLSIGNYPWWFDSFASLEAWSLQFSTPGDTTNGVLVNDSDPDGDTLHADLVTGPTHAARFALNPDGSFEYVHDGSWALPDYFTYRVIDDWQPEAPSAPVTVAITVTEPIDQTPPLLMRAVALDDHAAADADNVIAFDTPVIRAEFSEAILGSPNTSVTVIGPGGPVVAQVTGFGADTLTIEFPSPLDEDGQYTVTFSGTGGHAITDVVGNRLGDAADAQFAFKVDTRPPLAVSHAPTVAPLPPVDAVVIHFAEGMDTTSFAQPAELAWLTSPAGTLHDQIIDAVWTNDHTLQVNLCEQTVQGPYALVVGPGIRDKAGNSMTDIYRADFWIGRPPTWHNAVTHFDVDDSGGVTALDVLMIISYINSHTGAATLPTAPAEPHPFVDVNNDDHCTPLDVLLVIDYINGHPSGEGEAGRASSEQTIRLELPLPSFPVSTRLPSLPDHTSTTLVAGRNIADHNTLSQHKVRSEMPALATLPRWAIPLQRRLGADATSLARLLSEIQESVELLAEDVDQCWNPR